MMTINRQQAEALATLIATLRPEWDTPGIMSALAAARDRSTAWDLSHAALHAAANPKVKTPAIIAMAGEHWTAGKALGETTTRAAKCTIPGHTSFFAHNCGACRADELEAAEPRQVTVGERVSRERVREILEQAR